MRKDKESMFSIKSLEACDVQAKCISHEMHCSRHIDYSVQICRFSISSLKQMFLCVENWGLETLEYKVADPSGELPRAHSHRFMSHSQDASMRRWEHFVPISQVSSQNLG